MHSRLIALRSIPSTYPLVAADLSIDCDSEAYTGLLVYALVMLALYTVGVPLALMLHLYKWRHQLNPAGYEDESRAIKARLKHTDMMADPIVCNFALQYRPHYYWYEVYSLGRRFALTSLVLAFPTLESSTVYVLAMSFFTMVLDREWSAHIDGMISAFGGVLNMQIFLFQLYLLLLDAKFLGDEHANTFSVGLLLLSVAMMVAILSVAAVNVRRDQLKDKQLALLHDQIVIDKEEDRKMFMKAWRDLINVGMPGDEARLLEAIKLLADKTALENGKQPAPTQRQDLANVDALLEEADTCKDDFHRVLRAIITMNGGEYLQGPNKVSLLAHEIIESTGNSTFERFRIF